MGQRLPGHLRGRSAAGAGRAGGGPARGRVRGAGAWPPRSWGYGGRDAAISRSSPPCGLAGMTAYQLLLNTGNGSSRPGRPACWWPRRRCTPACWRPGLLGERLGRRWWAGSGVALAGTAIIAVSHGLGFRRRGARRAGRRHRPGRVPYRAKASAGPVHRLRGHRLRHVGRNVVRPALGRLVAAGPAAHAGGPALASAVFLGVAPSALGFVLWAYWPCRGWTWAGPRSASTWCRPQPSSSPWPGWPRSPGRSNWPAGPWPCVVSSWPAALANPAPLTGAPANPHPEAGPASSMPRAVSYWGMVRA